jgi:hypothetical protein
MDDSTFRDPTDIEARIVGRLLQIDFPQKENMLFQMQTARVRTVEKFGSIKFEAGHGQRVGR